MQTIKFERLKEILNGKAYKEFMKFMEGQTIPERDEVYEYDFLRWLYGLEILD